MALILGQQETLTFPEGGGGATFVGTYDSLALPDGPIVVAASDGFSPVSLFLKAGPAAPAQSIGTVGDTAVEDISLFDLPAGRFGVVFNSPVDDRGGDDRILFQSFEADGTPVADAIFLRTGDIDDIEAAGTRNGFAVSFEDRGDDATAEEVTVFYAPAGAQVRQVDFDDAGALESSGQASLLTLNNGNVALQWREDDGDLRTPQTQEVVQVYTPAGRPAGPKTVLPDGAVTGRGGFSDWTTLPDGGFVIVALEESSDPVFRMQTLNADGTLRTSVVLPAGDADITPSGGVSVSVNPAGLIAIAYEHSYRQGFDTNVDTYMQAFALDGTPVYGPQRVNDIIPETQEEPNVLTLSGGNFYVTHLDEEFEPFGYQDAVQGVLAAAPATLFIGEADADNRDGTPRSDAMIGKGGDDRFVGFAGRDYLQGDAGDDSLFGAAGADTLDGGDGADVMRGGTWGDVLTGGAGGDILNGGFGDDILDGGSGFDVIVGAAGDDTAQGGDGNDRVYGGLGDDSLEGEAGNDLLGGAAGNDIVNGGSGDDRVYGGGGDDVIDGDDGGDPQGGDDRLFGSAGNDRFFAGAGDDRSFGGSGNDTFNSGGGNDLEFGGAGDDYFVDTDGNDRSWGGAGADRFEWSDTDFGRDRIEDFEAGVDTLDMGNLAFSLDQTGADPIRAIDVQRGTWFYVDADNWVLVVGVDLADFQAGDYIV